MRRLLADPFALASEIPAWEAPPVPPEAAKIRAARQELERGLQPATSKHMRWCLTKLSALPSKENQEMTFALFAENFIDACGEYPDDLWTEGTLELLKTKTFRPSPAELVTVLDRKFQERKRMLQRAQMMLAPKQISPARKLIARFESRPAEMLARHSVISRRRAGLFGPMPPDTESWWVEIQQAATAEGLDPGRLEDWAAPQPEASTAR